MLKAVSFVLLSCCLISVAGAEETTDPTEKKASLENKESVLDEIKFLQEEVEVQVATKTKIPISKAPGAVSVITYEQIRQSGASSIPEMLRLVPGVTVRWNPMVQTISIRGFGQNIFTSRVLLLIDGIPYNSWEKGGFPQQPGFDFFPIENVKQLEVIRGPGSSLYGENAYWGVINIVTLSGEDLMGGKAQLVAGSRNTAATSILYGNKITDGSFLVSGKFLQSQFPTNFWAKENDSDVHGTDLFLKGRWKDLELSYYRHEDQVDGFKIHVPKEYFGPVGLQDSSFASAPKIEQNVDIYAAKYDYKPKDKPFSVLANVSFAKRFGMHCAGCHDAAVSQGHDFTKPADHGSQLFGDLQFGLNTFKNNNILLGVEYRLENVGDHKDELTPGGVGKYDKTAYYIQDQIAMLDDRLNLVIGARYDGRTNPYLFGESFSPRIAATYQATDALLFRAGWSKATRFPSFSELYLDEGFINLAPNPFVPPNVPAPAAELAEFRPNFNLHPEHIQTVDLGFAYQINPSFNLKTDLFYSEVSDFIVMAITPFAPISDISFENHPDKARIVGGEVELRAKLSEGMVGFIHVSYQDDSQKDNLLDSTGKKMEFVYASPFMVGTGVTFHPFTGISGMFDLSWRDRYEFPSYWQSLRNGGMGAEKQIGNHSGYALANFRLNYDLPVLPNEKKERPIQMSFIVRNLLNEHPEESVVGAVKDGYSLLGREYFVRLGYEF